jgi:hypothetical protein
MKSLTHILTIAGGVVGLAFGIDATYDKYKGSGLSRVPSDSSYGTPGGATR